MLDRVGEGFATREHDVCDGALRHSCRAQPGAQLAPDAGQALRPRRTRTSSRGTVSPGAQREQGDVVFLLAPREERLEQGRASLFGVHAAHRRSGFAEPLQAEVERLAALLDRAVGVEQHERTGGHVRQCVRVPTETDAERERPPALEEDRTVVRADEECAADVPRTRSGAIPSRVEDRVDERGSERFGDRLREAAERFHHLRGLVVLHCDRA